MRKITKLMIGFCLISAGLNAQAPNWSWAKSAGGSAAENGMGVAVDINGNTYSTGSFSSSSLTFGTTSLPNSGGLDFFLVKYDPSGNVLWAKGATGVSNDGGYKVTTDAGGNVYVVGSTNSSSLTFGSVSLTLHGYDDIFIVKYDPAGNVLWAKDIGGSANDIGVSIAADAGGNAYITGYFASSSVTFGSNTLTNAGGNDLYVAKYDPSGNILWAKSAGGAGNETGNGIATDQSGNVYVTGSYSSSSISFGSLSLTNGGAIDYFTVKYSSSGTALWAQTATGVSNDVGYDVKTDPGGNILVLGSFNSSSLTIGGVPLTLKAYDDIFIVKYDPSGTVLWAKSAGGTANDIGQSISVDAHGDSYITGYFASTALAFGTTTLSNVGTNNTFVAEYDASGNVMWAKAVGGSGDDRGNCIAADIFGNSYLIGNFSSPSLTLGSSTLTNSGGNDLMVAKLLTSATGITEYERPTASLSVYPNPDNGSFTLLFHNIPATTEGMKISVVDILGREVYRASLSGINSSREISLEGQPDGLYYVRVTADHKQYSCTAIVRR